ncbi:hypothetical protein N7448_006167 [Penicillium atrosanguineum]|uniref:Sulfatase N-terminal domain-containing protein n=1 Tax=Penicillium atrosanguineum TaxID=1132637 RepID=A0A9W9GZ85_9EURO|nr:uncharacterized protein N7443_009931 [Penicillium atrosanguineum]KAJ5132009.1 hypothetical protein N7448_006167 [Penicillium atrosanguineum]KAJ5137780.1 hypothetical protein N7526_004013 [Penicillium atrosanguineum]KAJ5289678.1 hypothetical protein N7443_009931 [Penicillium atrosanguineum]KAJ5307495.1 hypothetical protein N7476_008151 [Penicillium atrosanguineum]
MKGVKALLFMTGERLAEVFRSPGQTLDAFSNFARCYFYALAFWSLITAKLLHLYAHLYSLPGSQFVIWGITFFFQDVAMLLFLRIIAQRGRTRPLAALGALVLIPFSLIVSGMAAANFSVYVFTGAEIHWKQAKSFTNDAAAIRTLLTGLTGFLVGEAIIVAAAILTGRFVHRVAGGLLHVLAWPLRWLFGRVSTCLSPLRSRLNIFPIRNQYKDLPDPEVYERIALEDDYLNDTPDDESDDAYDAHSSKWDSRPITDRPLPRVLILGAFSLFLLLRILRPPDSVLLFLSGTLPLTTVFQGGHRGSPVDISGVPLGYSYLDGAETLHPPPKWSWMPKDPGPGFRDWEPETHALHYDGAKNPLHISNLQEPLLKPVQKAIADNNLKIKHVVLLKLESARADIFPLRNDSFMRERIAGSYQDNQIPEDVLERIANLTPTANYLTGFDTGFGQDNGIQRSRKAYGGLSARNAYTTSTYTLKSLEGTLCGVSPLVADLNREFEHHIYQPCMPQVFDMLSRQPEITNKTDDFTLWPWHSIWMQSVTETYDNQDKLTPKLGYFDKQTKETIEHPDAKHFPPKTEEVNYYGYADTELKEYIRDAIDDAESNHERLFLTHLTGTTHHPWGLPNNAYEQIMGSNKGHNEDLNRYLNTIGFVDGWLQTILDILEEKGVADETLLVMAGDHGLSLPNDGGITPYDNPHVGNFQVPIVFAHPKLPPIEIKAPVSSIQIVPSIIDLLIESSSIPKDTSNVARDIRSLYEGQSLIRPLIQERDGKKDWQFTVMNTGGTWLSVRSAARPELRLVIPLINDVEWRFSDLTKDPNEDKPIMRFNLADMAHTLQKKYDDEILRWLFDAVYVANWWVKENWDRYGYNPHPKHHDR